MTTGVKLGNAATSYITNSRACTFHNPLISIQRDSKEEGGETDISGTCILSNSWKEGVFVKPGATACKQEGQKL